MLCRICRAFVFYFFDKIPLYYGLFYLISFQQGYPYGFINKDMIESRVTASIGTGCWRFVADLHATASFIMYRFIIFLLYNTHNGQILFRKRFLLILQSIC